MHDACLNMAHYYCHSSIYTTFVANKVILDRQDMLQYVEFNNRSIRRYILFNDRIPLSRSNESEKTQNIAAKSGSTVYYINKREKFVTIQRDGEISCLQSTKAVAAPKRRQKEDPDSGKGDGFLFQKENEKGNPNRTKKKAAILSASSATRTRL